MCSLLYHLNSLDNPEFPASNQFLYYLQRSIGWLSKTVLHWILLHCLEIGRSIFSLVGKTNKVPTTSNISISLSTCLLILLRLILWNTMPVSFLSLEYLVVLYPRLGRSGTDTTGWMFQFQHPPLGCPALVLIFIPLVTCRGCQSPLSPGNLVSVSVCKLAKSLRELRV